MPYTITASPGLTLTISGVGITNNSRLTQNLATVAGGEIRFANNATAGSNVSISNEGGATNFFNHSSAAGASISNEEGGTTNFFDRSSGFVSNSDGGTTNFFDRSTGSASNSEGGTTNFFDHSTCAGSGENGATNFFNSSTAGNSDISNVNGGSISVSFADHSTAGNAQIIVGDQGHISFGDNSTAGNASVFCVGTASLGLISFSGSSTAGSATIGTMGGFIEFFSSSRGGTAQIFLQSNMEFAGELFISGHNAPGMSIGSIAGDEDTFVHLGANNLTVGSNNLSTTFSGEIGGTGGSLTKIGSGTLILAGANAYTGNTNVNRGVLQVDGSITSNTFVNRAGTLAGTGTINGNVTNNGRVSPGSAGAPGMLTIVHNYTQAEFATLMIQIAGVSPDQFSVLNVMGNTNLNGFLDPVLLNGFVPTIGDSFIFLNYASFTGEFSHIKHQIFDNGMLQWSVIYEDNNAILTVGPNTIPDQGSTFLLLTLGLLGLVTYQRQLLRGQT
jgi:autotransporter-associated beta strand protein